MSDKTSGQAMGSSQPTGNDPAAKFLAGLYATRPDEIQCDEVAADIVRCADLNLGDEQARKRFPAMFHHFRYCADCAAEYALVMDLVRAEAAGQLEIPATIPPIPTYTPPRAVPDPRPAPTPATGFADLIAAARGVAWQLVEALTPRQPALARSLGPDSLPAILPMEGGSVTLTLTVRREPADPGLRRIVCTVAATDPDLAAMLPGAPLQLLESATGRLVEELLLDADGDGAFGGIAPGVYSLLWSLGDESFAATGLEVG